MVAAGWAGEGDLRGTAVVVCMALSVHHIPRREPVSSRRLETQPDEFLHDLLHKVNAVHPHKSVLLTTHLHMCFHSPIVQVGLTGIHVGIQCRFWWSL